MYVFRLTHHDDLEKIKIIRGDYDTSQLNDVMCKNNTIVEIVETTKEYIEKSEKTIVFAVDINHAELLTKAYIERGFKARALHSKTKKDDNEAVEIEEEIEKFERGETKILVSVLMLTTGFDVPNTDCAIIARPTRSQNLYKQMVGRVLRIADNKTHAVLLDCGNVIKNLGMPLDPVREIDGNEIVNKPKCINCNSEKLQLIKRDDGLYWKCQNCFEVKKVDEGGYKCEKCSLVSSHEGKFSVDEDKIFLDCECGYKTLISEYLGDEEFIEVEDNNGFTVEIISAAILERTSDSLYEKKIKYYTDISEKVTCKEAKNILNKYGRLPTKDELLVLSNIKFYDLSNHIGSFEFGKWFKRNKNKRNNNLFITKRYLKKFDNNFPSQLWTEDNYFIDFQYGFYWYNEEGYGLNISFISEYHYEINTSRIELAHVLYVQDVEEKDKYIKEIKKEMEIRELEIKERKEINKRKLELKNKYLSFSKARKFVRKLKFKSIKEWKEYCKESIPSNIPKNPKEVYKGQGWVSIFDWIGLL